MHRSKLLLRLFILVGVSVLAQSASAQPRVELLSFTYSDLVGEYDGSIFTAVGNGSTNGDVTRLINPGVDLDATFDGLGGANEGEFSISMSVFSPNATMAAGLGTITLTDIDGDTYGGSISGQWINVGGSANFIGVLSNIVPTGNGGNNDTTFDGDNSSFLLDFPATNPVPYTGNVITLAFQNWFTDAPTFADATTLSSGVIVGAIVPEPATLGLLLLGGVVAGLRVRRQ